MLGYKWWKYNSNKSNENKDKDNKENNKENNNEQNQNNSNQNNEENRANVTYKPDNDKTDINFDDLTNNLNNNTKSKGANPSSITSHKISKKKSGIVISDDIDEDEVDADGVIFKNRGRIIYEKNNNVSEETNHNF